MTETPVTSGKRGTIDGAERCANTPRPLTHLIDSTDRQDAVKATRECSVAICDRPVSARGWCKSHYERWRTTGDAGNAPVVGHKLGPETRNLPFWDRDPLCAVDWCDRPVVEGHVCTHCSGRLERALGDIPALAEELDTVLTKQARYADPEGRGNDPALMFNTAASELGWVLRNTLSTWCRLIADERGKELPGNDTPAAIARWLLHHVEWLRHHRAGHEAVEEITSVVNQIRKAIDRPAARIYVGPCRECETDMYGRPDSITVKCKNCGEESDVEERWAWMREQVYGRLVTTKEAVVLLSRFGLPVAQKTIDKWRERKRVLEHQLDEQGRRLYLFDDLMTLAAANTPSERAS